MGLPAPSGWSKAVGIRWPKLGDNISALVCALYVYRAVILDARSGWTNRSPGARYAWSCGNDRTITPS
jgi:hypothetical protein